MTISTRIIVAATIVVGVFVIGRAFAQSNHIQISPPPVSDSANPNPDEKGLIAADWAAWATAIASVVNLAIVVWLFVLADRSHRRDRQEDFYIHETERMARVAGFWIEELVMRPNHGLLLKFFDETEDKLKSLRLSASDENHNSWLDRARQEIEAFKAEYHRVNHRVVQPLQWVHNDFSDLFQILERIEDLVTTELSRAPGLRTGEVSPPQGKKMPEDQFADLRREFFQKIHQVQTKALRINSQTPGAPKARQRSKSRP